MYFHSNDRFQELRDVDGNVAADTPRGEPILLTAGPGLDEEGFQRVEGQMANVAQDGIFWTAYVKHSDIPPRNFRGWEGDPAADSAKPRCRPAQTPGQAEVVPSGKPHAHVEV